MSRDLNRVMLIGRLGSDPAMRYTPTGTPVANFRMAVNHRRTTPEGESHDDTTWLTVVAWQRLAETIDQYVRKGRRVYVEGRLQTRQWEDQSGQKRNTTEVVATDLIMLDPPPERGAQSTEDEDGGNDVSPDDLPF